MAKKKAAPAAPAALVQPTIYEASLGADGSVLRGGVNTQAEAETRCGHSLPANRTLAGAIEKNANGSYRRCPPHVNAGTLALPHYQPDPRPPAGHTFYETPHRKAR
jgi:hypothetical protein